MTSQKTNQEIKKILDQYLTPDQQIKMFYELSQVKGNKSFTDTIKNLKILIWQQHQPSPKK